MNRFDTNGTNPGFKMTFENGFTVSVIWGKGAFGSGDSLAEVAAWDANGNWFALQEGNDVIGWQTPNEVLAIMNKIATLENVEVENVA